MIMTPFYNYSSIKFLLNKKGNINKNGTIRDRNLSGGTTLVNISFSYDVHSIPVTQVLRRIFTRRLQGRFQGSSVRVHTNPLSL